MMLAKPFKKALLIPGLLFIFLAVLAVLPVVQAGAEGEKEDFQEVLIHLEEQADTGAAAASARASLHPAMAGTEAEKNAVRTAVVETLRKTADSSQSFLLEFLASEKEAGRVAEYKSYYIVNVVYASLQGETLTQVEEFPEVKEILPNEKIDLFEPPEPADSPAPGPLEETVIEWNIERIGAPGVWEEYGLDGSGITIGIIDSGVQWEHEALKDKWRGFDPAKPEQVEAEYNWFDAVEGKEMPYDDHRHGTHVTGTALGAGPDGKNLIGTAPGANWIAAKVFDSRGSSSREKMFAAGQYMLAPTGEDGEPRPEKAPDIINNSWGNSPGRDDWYREMVTAWRDAGILPVFAAGNQGPDPKSVLNPGNYPESFAVGATGEDDTLATFSSRGPGPYEKNLKPDLSAPGDEIRSSAPENEYRLDKGTSMAAPHVAGTAALLLSAGHQLSVDELETYLTETASPLTSTVYPDSPNYGFGYGLLDASAAVRELLWEQGGIPLRIAGENRYQTAAKISEWGWEEGAETVFLARGDDFPDSLAAAPLAYFLDAPLLLSPGEKLHEQTAEAIKNLGAGKVIILGGKNAISKAVEEELTALEGAEGELELERIYGSSRYETAAAVARMLAEKTGEPLKKAFIVSGENYPDALSTAAYSAAGVTPVLLSKEGDLPEATVEVIEELGINEVIIVGGETAIGAQVETGLQNKEGLSVERVAGADRYKTSLALLQKHLPEEAERLFIATGEAFPDALAGGVFAAKEKGRILLVPGDRKALPVEISDYLEASEITRLVIYGGTRAVSEEIAAELEELLKR